MKKPKPEKPFVEGLSIAGLLAGNDEPKKEKRHPGSYDFHTEILDEEEGWIYEKVLTKRGKPKKGKKLRKVLQNVYGGWGKEEITFWKSKLNDLAFCEAKRWKAVQYKLKQFAKITGVFEQVLANTPFCCIRMTNEAPGYAWVVFPNYRSNGVSWEWWESNYKRRNNQEELERPNLELRQDIGDAWFDYEKRSQQIRERVGYFEQVFHKALEQRYADEFYRDRDKYIYKKKLVINGREYLIGETNNRSFGVIAYPESTITEIVAPGPVPKKRLRPPEWEISVETKVFESLDE